MTIEERTSGNVTVLDVAGRMTIETVGDMPLLAKVRQLLQGGRARVVLNLARVPSVDTTGIAELVEAYVSTRRHGGLLKLLQLTPRCSSGAHHDPALDDPGGVRGRSRRSRQL